MKFYFKNTIKLGILIFGISLLFWNCEKETVLPEEINQVEDQESTFSLKHYSREHIEKNTKLVSRLKKFSDKVIENKSAQYSGKNVYNEEYDFTIYTDSATYIQNGDYHSYTFPTLQEADEKITNVLFELNDLNEYDAFLVKYDYTANELKSKDFSLLSMKTSMEPIDLDYNSLFARTMSAYVCVYSYEYVRTGSHFTNGDSNLIEFTYDWVLTASYCENVYYEVNDSKVYSNGGSNATVTVSGTTPGSGSATSPTPSPPSPFDAEELMKIKVVKSELGLNHPERLWIDKWANGHIAFKIHDFCSAEMWSQEAKAFANLAIDVMMVDTEANPFLGADCRSFEYAQPPGALQRGCAVTNFNHTFYSKPQLLPNGGFRVPIVDSNISVAYFTAPVGMTNGRAANLTAIAVTAAIKATDLYFAANPNASKETVGQFFKNSINTTMRVWGGGINTTTPPFAIPSPAPYITSILGISNPIDCE